MWVSLSDVAEEDPALAEAVVENGRRYQQLFSDAVQELLPDFRQRPVGPPTPPKSPPRTPPSPQDPQIPHRIPGPHRTPPDP